MNLAELDALMASDDMAVRADTLTEAWDVTTMHERTALPAGQVLVLVTLRARAGAEGELAAAAHEFVRATLRLEGALGSSLHQAARDPQTVFLMERFANQAAFSEHMASEYFRTFQMAQAPLLAEPVQAHFLER